jgi:hypothetical protein
MDFPLVAFVIFDSPLDILVILVFALVFALVVPWLCYRHGKKVGDQVGYIRGYKEGQEK